MDRQYRPGLPDMPDRIRALPVDDRGYPVPYFVAWVDGVPDFRVMDGSKVLPAVEQGRCWICGWKMGKYKTFPIGPMCTVTRVISEPPSHKDCAIFAAQACPFLLLPKAGRRDSNLPDGVKDPAGHFIKRNPGIVALWTTTSYKPFNAPGGVLFKIGGPTSILWYTQGRIATKKEAIAAIAGGYPILREQAEKDGPEAVKRLDEMVTDTLEMVANI